MNENEKVDALLQYMSLLMQVGLDSKQVYHKFIMACGEVDKELGIDK